MSKVISYLRSIIYDPNALKVNLTKPKCDNIMSLHTIYDVNIIKGPQKSLVLYNSWYIKAAKVPYEFAFQVL